MRDEVARDRSRQLSGERGACEQRGQVLHLPCGLARHALLQRLQLTHEPLQGFELGPPAVQTLGG
jgi:hypothetical protein